MIGAGDLDRRVAFQSESRVADGHGGHDRTWATQFQAWARVIWLRGSESVQAARLEGRKPAVFTVYDTASSRAVTVADRILLDGEVYNVKSVAPAKHAGFLDVLAESGVAT